MIDSRRATVLVDTPTALSSSLSGRSGSVLLRPVRWAVMKPSTSAARTSWTGFATTAKNSPQVVGRSEQRVRPTSPFKELQVFVNERHPETDHQLPRRTSRTNQTRIEQRHLGASSSVDRQPQRLVEISRRITCITSMTGCLRPPCASRLVHHHHAHRRARTHADDALPWARGLSRTRESASADPRERFRESATLLARIRD